MRQNVTGTKRAFTSYTKYAFSLPQYEKVRLACRTTEETLLIGIGCELGLRREDVVSLESVNVDLQNKTITFAEHKKHNKLRRLPLPDQLIQDLYKHFNTFDKVPKFIFPAKRKSKTGHMSGMEAWRTLQEICKRADIPSPPDRKDRPFHALRGTCYKLKQHRDHWTIEQAAALLGDSPSTTMAHYGSISDIELENLVRGVV